MALTDSSTLVRTTAAVTTSYVTSEKAQVGNSSVVSLDLDFALASLTSLEVQVQVKTGATWRIAPVLKATSGTVSVYPATFVFLPADWGTSATGTSILLDVANAEIRIQAKGTGTVTLSSLAATVTEGNND